jgi:hypothetical protein
MAKTRKRKGQIARIVEPEYLSIVKSPSNRTGFKIIRSADNTDRVMRFRKKRSDTGLLSIDLPAGVSLDQAQSILELFDLGEDYEIAESGGVYSLIRKGSDMSVDTVTINLGEGIFANVASSSFGKNIRSEETEQGKFDNVQLVALEFTGDDFTSVESVREWLDSRDIDFIEGGVHCDEFGVSSDVGSVPRFTVLRTSREDAANCTQNMTVSLGSGVTGILGFAEETDIPKQVYRQIVETAYGSWGIWQLDFTAALADKEFTDESYEAMDTLNMVLHNVMFSDKTIAERKTLVQSVLKQFGQYVNSLLDSLPTEVMRKTYSKDHKLLKQESDNMSNEAKKVDGQDGAENTPAADTKIESMSRADVEAIVSDAIAKAIGPVASALETLAAQVQNSAPAEESKKDEGENKSVDAEEISKISRSVAEMGESMKTVMDSITALKGQVEEIGNTTVARSDDSNDSGASGEQSNKRNSPFAGLFNGLGVGAR